MRLNQNKQRYHHLCNQIEAIYLFVVSRDGASGDEYLSIEW